MRAGGFCCRALRSWRSASGCGRTEFAERGLSEYDIAYLFADDIAERIRPGQRREPVLVAWGLHGSGAKVLLHLMAGSKEDAETVSAFLQDTRRRGVGDPLVVVSDGVAGASSR